ncbi:DUF3316 domain-containing protein [Psychromonas antarctica]|nr:DUF3316 domain-containing protein [Psychromonas antarctica]
MGLQKDLIDVDQTGIKAEKFALSRDDIQYRAVVNVTYHFDTNNSN